MEASKIPYFHEFVDPFSSSVGDDLLLLPLQQGALTKEAGTTKAQRWPVPMAGVSASPLMPGWSMQLSYYYYKLTREAAAVTRGYSQSYINPPVYYSKKKGLMIHICPHEPASSHARANAAMNGAGKATAVPGKGHFPGKPFKQIWEEGSAVPLLSRAPQEAVILAAPLPVIEISCLSLTNPLSFH